MAKARSSIPNDSASAYPIFWHASGIRLHVRGCTSLETKIYFLGIRNTHSIQNVRSVPIALLTILKTPRRAATSSQSWLNALSCLNTWLGSCKELHAVKPEASANIFMRGDVLDNPNKHISPSYRALRRELDPTTSDYFAYHCWICKCFCDELVCKVNPVLGLFSCHCGAIHWVTELKTKTMNRRAVDHDIL